MSTVILTCSLIAVLWLLFILARIASHLHNIHIDLSHIHDVLRSPLTWSFMKENKSVKKRIYWRDENGFRRWRKNA